MNPYSALANSNESAEPTDVEFFKFTGLVPDAKVALQEGSFDISQYPATVSLIAVSNKQGYFAAATTQGFTFGTTKALRNAFFNADKGATVKLEQENKISVNVPKPIRQVRFSADETQLLVATQGGIVLVYNVNDITTNKGQASAIHTFSLNQEILDLRPNAEALPNLAAVLFNNNQCKIIDITNGSTECEIPLTDVSAICWSPKGKQIVCGKLDGSLEHYDTKGERKASLNIPQAMSAGHEEEEKNRYVQDVLWIENHIFLVLYARPRANEDDEYVNDGFVINRKPASGSNEPQYIRLAEVTPIFTTEGRGNHFYMEVIRHLGQEIKHLVIIGNAATNELSVVGQLQEGEWATWMLPENGVASLPLSDEGSMDTYPLGLALDFTADEKLPPVDASENDVGVDPMPVFYYLNDEGVIGAYHCYNTEIGRKGESYNAMSSFLSSATTAPTTTTSTASVTQTPAPPATVSGFSAFGSVTTGSSSSFGDLLSGKSTSPPAATATSGFGSFGAPPASGTGGFSFSNLASTQKIPATPSAGFGALAASNKSTTAAPLFGSTTNIGFGSSTTFGASTSSSVDKPLSSFGSASATKTEEHVVPETKTATDSSSSTTLSLFGGMKLGQSTSPAAAEVPKSPFGGFGGFGSSSSTTKLATTTTTTTSAFGSTDIKAAPTSAFGSTSALGSTGGFGSFGSATATTTETKATPPATTTSAFGSTDTKAAFTSSFGSTSSLGSGGFGSLAKNTIPGATAPTFGSSSTLGGGFGSLAKNTVPGATAPSSTPLFGSGSGFGSLATTTKKTDENEAKSTTPAAAGKKSPFTVPSTASTTATAAAAATTTGSGIGLGISSTSKPTETKPATSSPTPIKSPASTPTPASPAATAATTTVDKDKAKATTAPSSTPAAAQKEKLKPTAAEGMAREYESLYITVCEGIDDLKTIHERIDIIMAANTDSTPKTEASIKDKSSEWNLNDVATFAKLTESIVANIQKGQASAAQIKEQLETLSINSKKSMDKKEDIRYLLQKEIDVEVVDLMDNRELDPETKTTLNHIENKSEASEHTLSDLEFKVQEYKKRNKIKNDHHSGELTLYSLHRTVRDIQRDTVARNNDMAQLEEKIANLKLNESKRRAQASNAGFSVEDLTDSENDEEEDLEYKPATTQYTARYLRRFNFLNDVCIKSSRRTPLQCPVDI